MTKRKRAIKNKAKKIKNYGISLGLENAHRKPDQDWVFGATSQTCIAEMAENERDIYLPVGEKQNIGEEKMDCVSRSVANILECKFNYLYRTDKLSKEHKEFLDNNGYITPNGIEFSDRFHAILSGTTRQGNSMIAPLEAVRKNGLIPKSMLPQVDTFDEYHDPKSITPTMKALGMEFLKRFNLNYEVVDESQFLNLLKKDMLHAAGYAWPYPINGEYPKSDLPINHAFAVYKSPAYFAFDNYLDLGVEGDFVKKLAADYDLYNYGYRTIISLNAGGTVTKTTPLLVRLIRYLICLFRG